MLDLLGAGLVGSPLLHTVRRIASTWMGLPVSKSDVTAAPAQKISDRTRRRTVALATLGNILEWYDFTVYGFLAVAVATNFFPNTDPVASLLATLAAFGAGFIARPIGGIIMGRIADRRGRKFVLLTSMVLMALGSLLLAVAPTYAVIGAAAPVLIVVARLCQGFSAGGEFGSSAVYMVEWAGPKSRGLFGSLHQVASYGGLLVGLLVVASVTAIVGPDNMLAWGWRIPFGIGVLLAFVVVYLRRTLEESPVFLDEVADTTGNTTAQSEPNVELSTFPTRGKSIFLAIGIVALWSVTSYVTLSYMPAFTQTFAGLNASEALWSTAIGCAVTVILLPIAGSLSDRIGRRPLVLFAAITYAIVAVPVFIMVVNGRSFGFAVLAQVIFSIPTAAIAGVGVATITELFSTRTRGVLVSTTSALSNAVFGGFGPFISTLLIALTGTPVAPSFYIVLIAIFALITGILLPELGRRALRK